MLEDNPILCININVLKFWGFIFKPRLHTFPIYLLVAILNVQQFGDLYDSWGDTEKVIMNAYFVILWFNALIRTAVVMCYRKHFENFMKCIDESYMAIRKNCDVTSNLILDGYTRRARMISKANLYLGAFSSLCFVSYPIFSSTKENRPCTMLEDSPILGINIKILNFWGFLMNRGWYTIPIYFLLCANGVTQIGDLYETLNDAEKTIKNAYLSILWGNGCIRGGMFLCYGKTFTDFMQGIDDVYKDIRQYGDVTANLILDTNTRRARMISKANLYLGAFSSLCFVVYPLFSSTKENRIHAYGTWFPFEFDSKDKSPYYEIIYTIQTLLTIPGCSMYIPFSNLVATYLIFGIARLQVLQHYLVNTKDGDEINDKFVKRRLKDCVKCHQEINRYVTEMNDLVTNLMFLEFLFFTVMLCALLFLLIIISKLSQILIVCSYIFMILVQLFLFYWHANELTLESLAVANAAYTGPWYEYNAPAKKTLQILMARAQRPLLVTVGNIYPMGLEMFQTILNSAYSYFTVLRGVYD